MFRTDTQTGSVWRQAALLPIVGTAVGIPFGPLQRDSHDHAPCSTRPRWRLRTTTRPRRRSSEGRDHALLLGPWCQRPCLPLDVLAWFLRRDSVQMPDPAASLARARGVSRRRNPGRQTPRKRTRLRRSSPSSRRRQIGWANFDCGIKGEAIPHGSSSVRRDPGSGFFGGTTPRHRPRRDQPFCPGRLPEPAGCSRSVVRMEECSSPAPVAGGGARPLHLLGDRWCATQHSQPLAAGCRASDRRSHARAASSPHVICKRCIQPILTFFDHFLHAGVAT